MFYDSLTNENPLEDEIIIWMDVRTAIEEGRIRDTKQVIESAFFKEKSTLQRYLLCELENYSEESMFSNIKLDDSPIEPGCTFFLGIDSAYKGKDNIDVCLACTNPYNKIRILDIISIKKGKWVDGKTSEKILKDILKIQSKVHAKFICVDIGWGVYIVEGLAKKATDFSVLGINFGRWNNETTQRTQPLFGKIRCKYASRDVFRLATTYGRRKSHIYNEMCQFTKKSVKCDKINDKNRWESSDYC